MKVKQTTGQPAFRVEIHNRGDRAIIGAAVTQAWWFGRPDYTWQHSIVELDRLPIVKPDRDAPAGGSVLIRFLDVGGNVVPKEVGRVTELGEKVLEDVPVMPDAVVVFMDANGKLWQTGTSIAPTRITSPPVKL